MAPRKVLLFLRIVGLIVVLLLLVTPVVHANRPNQVGQGGDHGTEGINGPPGGGGTSGGGDNGDPDDIALDFTEPSNPVIHSGASGQHAVPPPLVKIEIYRAGARHVLFFLIGIGR